MRVERSWWLRRSWPLALAACAAVCACGSPEDPAPPEAPAALLAAPAPAQGATRWLVLLDPAPGDEAAAAVPDTRRGPGAHARRAAASAAAYASAKARVLGATPAVAVVHAYPALPVLHVEVRSPAALAALRARPEVLGVVEDARHEAFLAESLPLIHQPQAAAAGATGAGTAVAILDTGLDYTNPAFGSCAAPGAPGCRVVYAADFAPDDGALDANGHGTNVAGIVAGVAPGADLIGLDVFDGQYAYSSDILAAIDWCVQHRAQYHIVALNMSLGSGGSTTPCGSDVFAGGVHAAKLAGIVVTAAAGNNGYADKISSPACVPDAVSVGAVYDSAMGGRAYSLCTDASTAADQVTCFSNSAPYLTLLAPGALITAAGITMAGTSQAAPHVAGAVAVLAGAQPTLDADGLVALLRQDGVPVTDPRNGVQTPRVDLGHVQVSGCPVAIGPTGASATADGGIVAVTVATAAGCPWTASSATGWLQVSPASGTGGATVAVTVAANPGAARTGNVTVAGRTFTVAQAADATPPTGSVALQGSPAVVRTRAVTLLLAASDPVGVGRMCVSNTTTCTAWQPYATTLAWNLAAGGSGVRRVYASFKDAAGNVGAAFSASVVYDVTPPAGGKALATPSDAQVLLSWSGFTDPGSGLGSYVVVATSSAVPAAGCAGAPPSYAGTATSFTHTGLANGATYHYRVCAVDRVGNTSAGVTVDARPAPEYVPPTGTVAVLDGAALKVAAVTLALAASDASGVAQMCISNGTSCTAWEPYATTRAWKLTAGAAGKRTVRAWFKDAWGNVSAAPASTTVLLDATGPTGGTLTAAPGAGQVALSWGGFADGAGVGVASYVVVAAPSRAPASCAAGTVVYRGAARQAVHGALATGAVWGYRACGVDLLGNVGAGVARTATVR